MTSKLAPLRAVKTSARTLVEIVTMSGPRLSWTLTLECGHRVAHLLPPLHPRAFSVRLPPARKRCPGCAALPAAISEARQRSRERQAARRG